MWTIVGVTCRVIVGRGRANLLATFLITQTACIAKKIISSMIWSRLEWTDYLVYCLKTTHIRPCYNLPGVHFGIWHTPLESQNCVPPVTSLHEIISCLDSEPSIRVPSGQANVTDCPGVYSVPWWWQFLTQSPEITVCQTTLYQKNIKFKQINLPFEHMEKFGWQSPFE